MPKQPQRRGLPFKEQPTRFERLCRHWFMFATGFGLFLGGSWLYSGALVALAGGALLVVTGVAAGYHATDTT